MKFSFSDEQQEFRSVVRRFLEDTSPTTAVRRLMETDAGYDPEVWRPLSQDLGLTAVLCSAERVLPGARGRR